MSVPQTIQNYTTLKEVTAQKTIKNVFGKDP